MMIIGIRAVWWVCIVLSAWQAFPATAQDSGFMPVTGPCGLSFPSDHRPHPGYRTEWWYYTGNVRDADNRSFGFQLTFFRRGLQPPGQRETWPDPASLWRTDQLYLAHAAISDISSGRHLQAEQIARPVRSLAGAEQTGDAVTIHIYDWKTEISPSGHHLQAVADGFSFTFDLTPEKPVTLHGNSGYSRKGPSQEHASCYYSFSRLKAEGVLTVNNARFAVQGSAWMDHEFSTAPLGPGIIGWDWFSLQLSNQSEIMVYLLRQQEGTWNAASGGTFVAPTGRPQHLRHDEVKIQPLSYWTSPHSGARYPVKWRLRIDALAMELVVSANLKDQEMHTPRSTRVVYWEGSVHAVGEIENQTVEGVGYVELTGYAEPFDAPM